MAGFVLGSMFGASVMFVIMCCLQINKEDIKNDVRNSLPYKNLLDAYKKAEEINESLWNEHYLLRGKYFDLRDEYDELHIRCERLEVTNTRLLLDMKEKNNGEKRKED